MNKLVWRYLGFALSGLIWSLLCVWTNLWYLLFFNLILFDLFITRLVDWTLR
ncbi:MAG: hypothetical protein GQ579_09695, partial [Bacteroidales bacterium]|nr:hypothetical protein [Bacteroidales bacterium]